MFQSNFLFQELFIKSYSSYNLKPSNHFIAHTREHILSEITFAIERVSYCTTAYNINNSLFINFQYYNLPNLTIGSYGYIYNDSQDNPLPVQAILTQYTIAELDPATGRYKLDFTPQTGILMIMIAALEEVVTV